MLSKPARHVTSGQAQSSNSQIDRLGDRLRATPVADADLRELDAFRRSFSSAYEDVVRILRDSLNLQPSGRPAKSTTSIIEKLNRESVRLSQMQDVAGCRVVVEDVMAQDRVVGELTQALGEIVVVDRRKKPSHAYRAVHVVARMRGAPVEIQVRTSLQHLWAEVSECSASVGNGVSIP